MKLYRSCTHRLNNHLQCLQALLLKDTAFSEQLAMFDCQIQKFNEMEAGSGVYWVILAGEQLQSSFISFCLPIKLDHPSCSYKLNNHPECLSGFLLKDSSLSVQMAMFNCQIQKFKVMEAGSGVYWAIVSGKQLQSCLISFCPHMKFDLSSTHRLNNHLQLF